MSNATLGRFLSTFDTTVVGKPSPTPRAFWVNVSDNARSYLCLRPTTRHGDNRDEIVAVPCGHHQMSPLYTPCHTTTNPFTSPLPTDLPLFADHHHHQMSPLYTPCHTRHYNQPLHLAPTHGPPTLRRPSSQYTSHSSPKISTIQPTPSPRPYPRTSHSSPTIITTRCHHCTLHVTLDTTTNPFTSPLPTDLPLFADHPAFSIYFDHMLKAKSTTRHGDNRDEIVAVPCGGFCL